MTNKEIDYVQETRKRIDELFEQYALTDHDKRVFNKFFDEMVNASEVNQLMLQMKILDLIEEVKIKRREL